MIFPEEWGRPIAGSAILMSAVGSALTVQQIWSELRSGGYLRRARQRFQAWRLRRWHYRNPGLNTVEDVVEFEAILHGKVTEPSPLLHHTGEQAVSRLRTSGAPLTPAPMPVVIEFGEDTEPMIPEGVHGYRVGRRPIQMTLVRTESTGEHAVVRDERTPIFDACGPLPVLDLDVEFDWDRVVVEVRELVGVG